MHRNSVVLRFLPALAMALACSDGSEPITEPPPQEPERLAGTGYDLTLGENTVFLTPTQVADAMVAADSTTHTYTFDANRLAADGVALDSGEVLLIAGTALRRIASVTTANGQMTVTTSYASLNEAIESGRIEWNQVLPFTEDALGRAALYVAGEWVEGTAAAIDSIYWEYPVGANTLKASLKLQGSSAILVFQLTHEVKSKVAAVFIAKTTFNEMASQARIDIDNHTTRSFDYESSGLGGSIELSISAAGAGLDEFAFEWPEAMLRFPITIGPIPATLIVRAQVVTRLIVNGEASATASTSFSWGGDAGFMYNGSNISTTASADLGLPNVGSSAIDAAALIGNPVDAQFGFAAPRVEVALFGETIVPFIRPEFFVGSKLTWGPVCKSGYVRYLVEGGLDLRFLGTTISTYVDTIAGPHEVTESQNNCAANPVRSAEGLATFPELSFPTRTAHD
jgi:hypothetical protein